MPRTSPKSTAHGAAKGPSQRQLRVGEEIRHILAELLMRGEIHDEVLARHTVTVPEVRISPDLRLATAYVMPLGGKDIEAVVEALDAPPEVPARRDLPPAQPQVRARTAVPR